MGAVQCLFLSFSLQKERGSVIVLHSNDSRTKNIIYDRPFVKKYRRRRFQELIFMERSSVIMKTEFCDQYLYEFSFNFDEEIVEL